MPGPSVTLTLFEPVTYLRGQSTTLDSSRERLRSAFSLDQNNGESQPSQLRGLITVTLVKPTRIKAVELVLTGVGRTDWPEGIGSNRLELAEVAPIIKEEVVLFDARAEDAPAAPIRRANSVGPGVTGFNDDVDWSLMTRQPRSGEGAGSGGTDGKGKEREAPGLARSVGKAAAKAGTAILPPTLLREIANSRPDKKDKARARPVAEAAHSPPASSSSRRGSLSHLGSSLSPTTPTAFDPPPPVYQPHRPSDALSSSTSPSRSASVSGASPVGTSLSATEFGPIVGSTTSASGPTLPAQSVSAAGPHGRSILHAPRRGRSPPPEEDSLRPSQTGELASSSSVESRGRARDASEPSVRFDPRDLVPDAVASTTSLSLSPVASREQGRAASFGTGSPPQGNGQRASSASSSRQSKREPSVSAPNSRRPSYDAIVNALDLTAKAKGKGKMASGDSTPRGGSSSSAMIKKAGLKSLLGGLRREENATKKERPEIRSSASSSPSPHLTRRASMEGSSPSAYPSLPSGEQSVANKGYNSGLDYPPHQPPHFHSAPCDWREFKKGVYTYSISLPLPANLPPTIHADFGSNVYTLKALVRRPGALTPNLSTEKEVVLIHAPDEEGGEETDAIVVERTWEDSLTYRVFVSGRSFACGSKIPLWLKFIPLGEKIRIWRLTVVLEEKTHYYAKKRKIARHETPRRFTLLKLSPTNASGEASTSLVTSTTIDVAATRPLLPIVSDQPDALVQSPMGQYAVAAARLNLPAQLLAQANAARESLSAASGATPEAIEAEVEPLGDEARQDALATLLDPGGPWELSMDVTLPGKDSRINTSTDHKRSNITVEHTLRLSFRVEKARPGGPVGGKPMLSDIVIEAPVTINHSHTADAWLSLPNYWAVANVAPPTGAHAGSRSVPVPGTTVAGEDGKARYQATVEPDDYFASSHYPDPSSGRNRTRSGSNSVASPSRRAEGRGDLRSRRGNATTASGPATSSAEAQRGPPQNQSRGAGEAFHSAADQWLHLSEESRVVHRSNGGIGMVVDSMAAMDLVDRGAPQPPPPHDGPPTYAAAVSPGTAGQRVHT